MRALDWAEEHLGPIEEVVELTGGWTSTMLALRPRTGPEAVLRLIDREPWRTHGAELTTRESRVQQSLVGSRVPAPRSVALDARGERCGVPAHLMTRLPGTVDLDRTDDRSLQLLAGLLLDVHRVRPDHEVRPYQSWAWEAKYVVPRWAAEAGLWREAFALLRTPPPDVDPTFLHRDFQPRNVLWSGGAVTGLVDWVETSTGPAWLDVAHCSTNLALVAGSSRADAFADLYADLAGVEPQPYFDVMDVVGFLPPPGKTGWFADDSVENRRLEERLAVVLGRVG